MHGEPVRFAELRIVELGESARRSPSRAAQRLYAVTFGAEGPQRQVISPRPGGSASRCGKGPSTASRSPCRFARSSTAINLTYEGVEVTSRVLTEREAELAALMPVKEKADTSKLLLCPMPGMVVSLAVDRGPGGPRRRLALRR